MALSWRRMVGDSNSRVDKLRATVNAAPWSVVLTTDYLAPVALNQITPPLYSAFEFAGLWWPGPFRLPRKTKKRQSGRLKEAVMWMGQQARWCCLR